MAQGTGEYSLSEDVPAAHPTAKQVPAWLLVPGITVFVISAMAYLSLVRVIGLSGYDLSVYLMGGEAFRHGIPVYEQVLHGPYGEGYFTYPPVTLLFFGPLSLLPHWAAQTLVTLVGLAALLAAIWIAIRMLGYERGAGLVGVTLAIAGASLWLQPVYDCLDQGQVNILLMALVLADFALAGSRRWPTGVLIGVATALKITPGIFILFLLLSRRYRAAGTAFGTWLTLTLLGFVAARADSVDFWIHATFADSRRVSSPLSIGTVFNQSLNGVTHRLLGDGVATTVVWAALAVATVGLGFSSALALQRKGFVLGAVLACAVTGLLIAPLTWHEHWVWIVPIVICLAEIGRRAYPWAPTMAPALPCITVIPFLMWPLRVHESGQEVGPGSILSPARNRWDGGNHHPLIAFAGAAYVLVGVGLLVVAAYVLRRMRTSPPMHQPELEAEADDRSAGTA